jgi:CBS domain-containing protein
MNLYDFKAVPPSEWFTTTAAEAMIPLAEVKWVRPDTDLWAALAEMDRDGVNQLLVLANGQVSGVLSREDVISFLRTLPKSGVKHIRPLDYLLRQTK